MLASIRLRSRGLEMVNRRADQIEREQRTLQPRCDKKDQNYEIKILAIFENFKIWNH